MSYDWDVVKVGEVKQVIMEQIMLDTIAGSSDSLGTRVRAYCALLRGIQKLASSHRKEEKAE